MKLDCEVIRDLLPLYAEHMASPASTALVEEHLQECEACRAELEQMQLPVPVQPEPQPDAPLKGIRTALRKKRILTAAAAVLAVLCAAYCALCVFVGRSTTLSKGTAVNGVDIGGMTHDEAVSALESGLSGMTTVNGTEYAAIQVDPQIEGVSPYTVDLSGCLGYDAEKLVDQAEKDERGGMFFIRGVRYLSHLRGGKSYAVVPSVADESALHDALAASGLLELNTVVQTTYALAETTLDVTLGTSGSAVDEQGLAQEIIEHTAAGNFSEIPCPLVETRPDDVDLQIVHDAIYAEPANATLDVADDNTYTIVDSVEGIDFDVAQAQQLVAAAAEGETVSVPLNRQQAAIDTDTLKAALFRDELGSYTASVAGSADRRSNVKLAGQKCSGTILLPGETFDYNQVVGQRTAAAGFKAAAAYLNGETVQELGGGVCQPSSTLYCAVLYSNLEIVERHNHTYVSNYVPLGMDATVSWGGPDFIFRNNTNYPIKIVTSYYNNNLTVKIYGTNVDGTYVRMVSKTLSSTDWKTVYQETDELAGGVQRVEQYPYTGYYVKTWRNVYSANGTLLSSTFEAVSDYKSRDKIVLVGKAAPAPDPTPEPNPDPAPEPTPDPAPTPDPGEAAAG